MKNLIKHIFALSIIFSMMTSCNDQLEEININPNQSSDNPSLDLLFGAIVPGFMGQVIGSYGTPGQFTQQFALLNSSDGTLTQGDDAIARRTWEVAYSENNGALRNIELLKYESELQGNDAYIAIAGILKAYMLSHITDVFGDIPYKDAGQAFKQTDQYIFPVYDAQEEVYQMMIADLTEANDLLANSTEDQVIDASRDLLFEGEKLAWRKFANALKLRLLMRISDVSDVNSQVATIFNAADQYPLFESNQDAPAFSYYNTDSWPFSNVVANIEEIRLSATFVDVMKGEGGVNNISNIQDPRLSWLLNPTENSVAAGNPEFVGQPVGLASDLTSVDERSLLSENFRTLNRFWLMTFAELQFLRAEAIERGMISGNANEAYRSGVQASIEKYGIDGSTSEVTDYLQEIENRFTEDVMKHIAIQRWLDQPNYGYEGYAVWRRMDYPVLTLGPDVVANQIPTRYFYSSKTTDRNQANADVAINRAPLNGLNTIVQRVWWDID